MLVFWSLGVVLGLGLAVWASRQALDAAMDLGAQLGLSPFFIGMTIVAVGTDLPEIANSLVASASGHGDLNVGDSVGSVVTQITLVLGVICFVSGMEAPVRTVITAGSLTVLALVIGAALFDDQQFSRADGAVLIALWVAGTIVIHRPEPRETVEEVDHRSLGRNLWLATLWLAVVGVGATIAVDSFTRASDRVGAPQFLASFFVLSLGSSLPELVIAVRAIHRSANRLALGDLLGSSFVDATLSPGIGPLLFPTALSAGLARTNLLVAVIVAVVTAILTLDITHRWATGFALILLYLALYPALII